MKKLKRILLIAAIALIVALACVLYSIYSGDPKGLVTIDPQTYYKVTSVIDGDTFQADIDGKAITVRVLGINTPETVDPRKPIECYGPEASKEGKELLTGRKVRLAFNPAREKLDKYHRYLLYVYRDDGLFYNEYMIEHGFAQEYTFDNEPYEFQAEFKKAEAQAKAASVGLWGSCSRTLSFLYQEFIAS